jgi:hypothetical protein
VTGVTVAELIASLGKMPPDSMVLVSSDAEGNNVREVDIEQFVGRAVEEDGEWVLLEIHEHEAGSVPVVVIYPL